MTRTIQLPAGGARTCQRETARLNREAIETLAGFAMSELVSRSSVPAATVRYYLRLGLLPPPVRTTSNRHLYGEAHVQALRLVRLLQERRGLSLAQVAEVLPRLSEVSAEEAFRPEMWTRLQAWPHEEAAPTVAERLLVAGVELFSSKGLERVTVEEVCQAAGVAKGSFYRHFRSKDELFSSAASHAAEAVCEEFSQRVQKTGSPAPSELLAMSLAPRLALILDVLALAARSGQKWGPLASAVVERLRSVIARPGLADEAGGGSTETLGAALFRALAPAVPACS